ncbi:MAG: hypothetical protein ACJAW3_001188 [Lentimonas sp.]|jgi:hypothetical protein
MPITESDILKIEENGEIRYEINPEVIDEALENSSFIDLSNAHWLPESMAEYLVLLQNEDFQGLELNIYWPPHFGRNAEITAAKTQLNNILAGQREISGNYQLGSNLVKMLGRYLDGYTKSFDDELTKSVVKQVESLLLSVLEKNTESIEYFDGIASQYLEECNNRPAFGFIEMVVYATILQEPLMGEKVNLAKKILILDDVVRFVKKDSFSPESEIEKGIVLLKRLGEISQINGENCQPFFSGFKLREVAFEGIPAKIEEGFKLNDEETVEFYQNYYMPTIKQSASKTTSLICEISHIRDIFAAFSLPRDELQNGKAEIEGEFNDKFEIVRKLILGESCEEMEKKVIEYLLPKTEAGKSQLRNEPLDFWSEKFKDLSVKKEEKTSQMIQGKIENQIPKSACETLTNVAKQVCGKSSNQASLG